MSRREVYDAVASVRGISSLDDQSFWKAKSELQNSSAPARFDKNDK